MISEEMLVEEIDVDTPWDAATVMMILARMLTQKGQRDAFGFAG